MNHFIYHPITKRDKCKKKEKERKNYTKTQLISDEILSHLADSFLRVEKIFLIISHVSRAKYLRNP